MLMHSAKTLSGLIQSATQFRLASRKAHATSHSDYFQRRNRKCFIFAIIFNENVLFYERELSARSNPFQLSSRKHIPPSSLIFPVSTSSENVTQHPVDFNFSCRTPINWISMSSKTLLIVATHAICCRPNLLVMVTTLADIYWPFSLMRNSSQFNVFGGGRAIKQRRSAGTTCWKRSNFQIFILHRRRSPTIGKYVILCEPLACCFVSGSFSVFLHEI